MADVFISYAREQRELADKLAAALTELGLTVWSDSRLTPGRDYEEEIERQLDAARAVIVIWSDDSVASNFVRAEAREALEQRKLVPIRSQDVRPPLIFRGLHFEDMWDWTGDPADAAFQRLAIQVTALVRGQDAAADLPLDGVTKPEFSDAAPKKSAVSQRFGPFRNFMSFLGFLTVFGGVISLAVNREAVFGPYWETVLVLALFAVALFQRAETDLSEDAKALVARWLRPSADAKPITAAQAFLSMFVAVFTPRHWTFACFWRSATASVLIYTALLLLWVDFPQLESAMRRLMTGEFVRPEAANWQDAGLMATETNAALLFVAVPLANIFVDYLSLWQTRTVLRLAAWKVPLPIAVVGDAILTFAVFLIALPLGPAALLFVLDLLGDGVTGETYQDMQFIAFAVWQAFFAIFNIAWSGELASAIAGEASLTTTSLLIALVTTFTTSAWLWLALIFAPIVRLVSLLRRHGVGVFSGMMGADARPIAPLGYVAAISIVAVGAGYQATTRANAANAGEPLFPGCSNCLEMVEIPAGVFTIGSPPDQLSRNEHEGPQTDVRIAAFSLGKYEVTFREWDICTRHGPCKDIPRGSMGDPDEVGDRGWGRGWRPVVTVSWQDAQIFIGWLNSRAPEGVVFRLPSEAEFEYALRGGTTSIFYTGDIITSDDANFDASRTFNGSPEGAYRKKTLPVGAFPPNPFGLYDMSGNVWEWVQDCYVDSYEGLPLDGSARTDGDCTRNIRRGGSWFRVPDGLRVAHRVVSGPGYLNVDIGFRVAMERVPGAIKGQRPPERQARLGE